MAAVPDDLAEAAEVAFASCLHDIRACRECKWALAHGPRPVVVANRRARLLIIGQAPGRIVHETGIPWNDRSGDRLRQWLQITYDDFYADKRIAVVPMGFCFPGTGANGDLPPRPECAPKWHRSLLMAMPEVKLTLLVGTYAQRHYLDVPRDWSLTDVVRNGPVQDGDGRVLFPLPHPSPRNLAWFKHNPWFDVNIVPALRAALVNAFA